MTEAAQSAFHDRIQYFEGKSRVFEILFALRDFCKTSSDPSIAPLGIRVDEGLSLSFAIPTSKCSDLETSAGEFEGLGKLGVFLLQAFRDFKEQLVCVENDWEATLERIVVYCEARRATAPEITEKEWREFALVCQKLEKEGLNFLSHLLEKFSLISNSARELEAAYRYWYDYVRDVLPCVFMSEELALRLMRQGVPEVEAKIRSSSGDTSLLSSGQVDLGEMVATEICSLKSDIRYLGELLGRHPNDKFSYRRIVTLLISMRDKLEDLQLRELAIESLLNTEAEATHSEVRKLLDALKAERRKTNHFFAEIPAERLSMNFNSAE
jgi:hypothetical protein